MQPIRVLGVKILAPVGGHLTEANANVTSGCDILTVQVEFSGNI
jgi:hypothetical protein